MNDRIRVKSSLTTIINETMENHISFQQDFNHRVMERPLEEFCSHIHTPGAVLEDLTPYLHHAMTCAECSKMVFEESGDPLSGPSFRMINIKHLRNILPRDLLLSRK